MVTLGSSATAARMRCTKRPLWKLRPETLAPSVAPPSAG
jgi:hypothetical protein